MPPDGREGFSFRALYRAYRQCRRRKRGTANAQRYDLRLLDNLVETAEALAARSWSPRRSVCFVTTRPKAREIHAADFADRVVHHWLVPRLEALFEPVFIHDSYSNRTGKGTHAAVARLQTFMRQLTANGTREAFFLQLDIRNFFNTIDRPTLLSLVRRRLDRAMRAGHIADGEHERLAYLTDAVLARDPSAGVRYRGTAREFGRVPPHKRLSAAAPGKGLPIGNLTSQFLANVYLNELDQFIKHRLRCRHYLRYVDDFVLLHPDPEQLKQWRGAIADFLQERLGLSLRDEGFLRPIRNGCDFLGYIVRPHYLLVRRRVVTHLRERLTRFERRLLRHDARGMTLLVRREEREALRAVLASYLGHFRHARTFRLIAALWRRYPWLDSLFEAKGGMLLPTSEPPAVTSLRSQWRFFRRRYPDAVVLMQVGNRVEAFGEDAPRVARLAGISADARPRAGLECGVGVPLAGLAALRRRLRRHGIAHLFVAEEGWLRGGMKRRVFRLAWRPRNERSEGGCALPNRFVPMKPPAWPELEFLRMTKETTI